MTLPNPRWITRDGIRMRVGSPTYRWWIRNRMRLRGKVPKPKPVTAKLGPKVLAMAAHYVGVKEQPAGSNMQMFGRWYGEDGVPWCAIFVSFVLSHSGRPFKYAYVPTIVADARAKKNGLSVVQADQVARLLKAGRVVLACFDWTHDGTADHVAFVKTASGGSIGTIEGNTGADNWSNGGEVLRENRADSLVQAFVLVS